MTAKSMPVGIIAAGEGSRFQKQYPKSIKPLIPVAGKPLVYWTVSHLKAAGVQSVTYLHNSRGTKAAAYLKDTFPEIHWTFLQRDTRSSFESFQIVSRHLAESLPWFGITTVDALISPDDISRFFTQLALRTTAAGALALTRFVDDEKPLWADCDEQGLVTAVGETAAKREFVTCGLYGLSKQLADSFSETVNFDRLRDFWTMAVQRHSIAGIPLAKTVDVDRPKDIEVAEQFLSSREAYASAR